LNVLNPFPVSVIQVSISAESTHNAYNKCELMNRTPHTTFWWYNEATFGINILTILYAICYHATQNGIADTDNEEFVLSNVDYAALQ
jgi:hypothetical protein